MDYPWPTGGWERNNITLFYARLGDGEAAYQSLSTLFRKEAGDSLFIGTRLAPAEAYEMNYNTGAAAGIAEMLLQSHEGCLALLPRCPRPGQRVRSAVCGRAAGLKWPFIGKITGSKQQFSNQKTAVHAEFNRGDPWS